MGKTREEFLDDWIEGMTSLINSHQKSLDRISPAVENNTQLIHGLSKYGLGLVEQIKGILAREMQFQKVIEILVSDYVTRKASQENRPREDVLKELLAVIHEQDSEIFLRIV